MQNTILDEEFRALLSALDNRAFAQLEEEIVRLSATLALNLENRYK